MRFPGWIQSWAQLRTPAQNVQEAAATLHAVDTGNLGVELAVQMVQQTGKPVHLTYGDGIATFLPDPDPRVRVDPDGASHASRPSDDALLAAILRRMIASQAEYAHSPLVMKDGYFALDSSAELSKDECAALLRAGVEESD